MMKLDLNLLRVFDILMEVRSVSRAADRLGLTQSAVSHALGRLREQLDDPLFVRAHGGLRSTQRADEIAPTVRDGLRLLGEALSQPDFDPAVTSRSFTISASSYFCVTILPAVIQRVREQAPLAQLHIVAPTGIDIGARFGDGSIDLALGKFDRVPSQVSSATLMTEEVVWIGRKGGGRDDLSTRPRLALAQPALSAFPDTIGTHGTARASTPLEPVSIHDPLVAGAIIADSDLIARWPRSLARVITSRVNVDVLASVEEPPVELSILWPSRLTSDAAHVWLRTLLLDAAAEWQTAGDS